MLIRPGLTSKDRAAGNKRFLDKLGMTISTLGMTASTLGMTASTLGMTRVKTQNDEPGPCRGSIHRL